MRNKATKKNMDLDLRRYGNKLYSKAEESGGSGGSGGEGGGDDSGRDTDSESLLMSLLPNNILKPDLFLFEGSSEELIDVTNYKIDNLFNLYKEEGSKINIMCVFESSDLSSPILKTIEFNFDDDNNFWIDIKSVTSDLSDVDADEIIYNNKSYYQYSYHTW